MANVDKKLRRDLTLGWKILIDKNLRPVEKLILADIMRQSGRRGHCWASNQFFSERFGISESTASRSVSELRANGYVRMELVNKKTGYERKLYPEYPLKGSKQIA